MTYVLPDLPWPKNALAPYISETTVEFHYEKHHRGYVVKLNQLAEGTDLAKKSLVDIIMTEKGKPFNLAAQIWNHTFYWNGMKANGGGKPTGNLGKAIDEQFGSFDAFQAKFNDEAGNHFGSGWAWLVREKNSNTVCDLIHCLY